MSDWALKMHYLSVCLSSIAGEMEDPYKRGHEREVITFIAKVRHSMYCSCQQRGVITCEVNRNDCVGVVKERGAATLTVTGKRPLYG